MFQLVKNEYIKLFKKPKNIMVLVLLIVCTGILIVMGYIDEKDTKKYMGTEKQINSYEEVIKNNEIELENIEKELNKASNEEKISLEESKSRLKENNLQYREEIKKLNKILEHQVEWKGVLEQEQVHNRKSIEELTEINEGIRDEDANLEEIFLIKDRIAFNEYYLENNIKPVYMWEMYPSFTLLNLSNFFALMIPIFIVMLGSDIVSDEGTNETFKFLLIQPEKRGKILISKLLTLISIALISIFGIQLIIFVGIGIVRGFPDLEMLVRIGLKYEMNSETLIKEGYNLVKLIVGSGEITNYGVFLGQMLILQAIYIIGCCFVTFMFSTIFKNNIVSLIFSTIVVIGGAAVPMFEMGVPGSVHLSFFIYGWTREIISGEMQWILKNPNILASVGATVIIVTSGIVYLIAHNNFKRKDIL